MSVSIRKNLTSIAYNIFWICLVGYFVYHVVSGARGVISWVKLSKKVEMLENQASELKESNKFLENKIKYFRRDNLDLDLLDEQARQVLGFANENDIVILLPKSSK